MPRARRREHDEEAHGSHERWLITYADMITLLMVLFIVLFAISQVDQKRFDQLKDGMAAGFGQNPSPFQGQQAVMQEAGVQPLASVRPTIDGSNPAQQERTQAARSAPRTQDQAYAEARAEVRNLLRLMRRVHAALAAHGLDRDVSMAIDERGLRISLVSRHIVFHADLADLTPRGAKVLDVLAPVLRSLPNDIEVDGHTNQIKVKPKFYPSDWELSAARAVTVLRHLNEQGRVSSRHMTAVAFGHEKPLMDPSLPHSQALNKRVDVVVLSGAREDARKLFDEVLANEKAL